MCLVLVGWRRHPRAPLVVAANRDEWGDRPTDPLHRWPEGLYAGRDRLAGGTWLAVRPDGAFAATTNMREPGAPPMPRSRGDLPLRILAATSVEAGVREVAADAEGYGGFHVIAADADGLWHASSRGEGPTALGPGVWGVSNGPRSAGWPKVVGGEAALDAALDHPEPDVEALFALLHDRAAPPDERLPDTGVGLELERALGSRFVSMQAYGTRSSTVVIVGEHVRVIERTWDTAGGWTEVEVGG